PSVHFLGWQPDAEVRMQLARCRALIFPGEEDFGITSVEAQASGRPVIAYGMGGALATIVEGSTGLFFYEQTPESLAEVVGGCWDTFFAPHAIRRHAEEFDTERFARRFMQFVEAKLAAHPTLARLAGLGYHGPGLSLGALRHQSSPPRADEVDRSQTRPAFP